MAKFFGKIGFGETVDVGNDIYEPKIKEREYYGDVLRHMMKNQPSEYLNDNITISNSISIVADPYAYENFHNMKYVIFNNVNENVKWKIENVELQYPRLILNIGGMYNEQQES